MVSIHAPHAGRDLTVSRYFCLELCFNPRAPCGARLSISRIRGSTASFQSTRPVRGATLPRPIAWMYLMFQSTRPVRGATAAAAIHASTIHVSIHAPRAGRDIRTHAVDHLHNRFNPRAPCGARPESFEAAIVQAVFQSTRPVRGATFHLCDNTNFPIVSIHAPHAGRDYLL